VQVDLVARANDLGALIRFSDNDKTSKNALATNLPSEQLGLSLCTIALKVMRLINTALR
jgi:hypothetical protein